MKPSSIVASPLTTWDLAPNMPAAISVQTWLLPAPYLAAVDARAYDISPMLATPPLPCVPESQQAVRRQFHRTQMCKSLLQHGVCREGCSFAHTQDDLRAPPDLRKTTLCTAWIRGECAAAHCRFAHGVSDLRGTAAVYKTQLCQWYASGGKCTRGAGCRHAHGEGELRPVEPVTARTGKPVYAI